MTPLKAQAIQTALTGDWTTAISLNHLLLEENPNDIDTLNRLAYAYMSTGEVKEAKSIYEKVLLLDMKNPIALRNLKRLGEVNDTKAPNAQVTIHVSNLFIEEPGKTKVVELINLADKKVTSTLRSGEQLELCIKRMKVFALDMHKQYIGMLPDDIGNRLINLINGGNLYESHARTVSPQRVSIFIREVKRAKQFSDVPSFAGASEKVKLTLSNSLLSKNKKGKHHSDELSDDDEVASE